MSTEFKREERYIVFKMSDLGNSLKGDEIRKLAREYAEHLEQLGKKPLDYVVIAADWSEYGPTWKAIEARVTGPLCVPEESAIQTAARIMNHELITERDNARRLADTLALALNTSNHERDSLRAKIEQMEKQEPVAWRTFDGEGGYDYRSYEDNENYKLGWDARNPNHIGWVEPLYALPGAKGEEK